MDQGFSQFDAGCYSRNRLNFKQHAARAALMAWQGVLSRQGEEILRFVRLYQLHPLPLP